MSSPAFTMSRKLRLLAPIAASLLMLLAGCGQDYAELLKAQAERAKAAKQNTPQATPTSQTTTKPSADGQSGTVSANTAPVTPGGPPANQIPGGSSAGTPSNTVVFEASVPPVDSNPDSKIVEVDKARFDARLKSFRGKVVLVDFWATWCGPCRQAFPHTVEMHRKYSGHGLRVVSISLDQPQSKTNAEAFLKQQGAKFTNYILAHPGDPIRQGISAIPTIRLYDKHGNLAKTLVAPSPQQLDAEVKPLLAANYDGPPGDESAADVAEAAADEATPAEDTNPDAKLVEINKTGFDAKLKSFRGKVLLVDFWATWCPPCVQAFPHTVELHRKYSGKGLRVASISLDRPNTRARAETFLKERGAKFDNWIPSSPQDPLLAGIEAIPTIRLYDKSGNLAKTMLNPAPHELEAEVKALLSAKFEGEASDEPATASSSGKPTSAVVENPPVKMTAMDEASFVSKMKSLKGKIVLVKFWAMGCPLCARAFPQLNELQTKYAGKGVHIAALCCDDFQNKAKAEEFLRIQAPTYDNWIAKNGRLVYRHQIQAIPVYKLYDKNGTIVKTMVRPQPGEIDKEIDALLSQVLPTAATQ